MKRCAYLALGLLSACHSPPDSLTQKKLPLTSPRLDDATALSCDTYAYDNAPWMYCHATRTCEPGEMRSLSGGTAQGPLQGLCVCQSNDPAELQSLGPAGEAFREVWTGLRPSASPAQGESFWACSYNRPLESDTAFGHRRGCIISEQGCNISLDALEHFQSEGYMICAVPSLWTQPDFGNEIWDAIEQADSEVRVARYKGRKVFLLAGLNAEDSNEMFRIGRQNWAEVDEPFLPPRTQLLVQRYPKYIEQIVRHLLVQLGEIDQREPFSEIFHLLIRDDASTAGTYGLHTDDAYIIAAFSVFGATTVVKGLADDKRVVPGEVVIMSGNHRAQRVGANATMHGTPSLGRYATNRQYEMAERMVISSGFLLRNTESSSPSTNEE